MTLSISRLRQFRRAWLLSLTGLVVLSTHSGCAFLAPTELPSQQKKYQVKLGGYLRGSGWDQVESNWSQSVYKKSGAIIFYIKECGTGELAPDQNSIDKNHFKKRLKSALTGAKGFEARSIQPLQPNGKKFIYENENYVVEYRIVKQSGCLHDFGLISKHQDFQKHQPTLEKAFNLWESAYQ